MRLLHPCWRSVRWLCEPLNERKQGSEKWSDLCKLASDGFKILAEVCFNPKLILFTVKQVSLKCMGTQNRGGHSCHPAPPALDWNCKDSLFADMRETSCPIAAVSQHLTLEMIGRKAGVLFSHHHEPSGSMVCLVSFWRSLLDMELISSSAENPVSSVLKRILPFHDLFS